MRAFGPPGPSSLSAVRAIVSREGIDPYFFTRTAERFPRMAHVRIGRENLYLLFHPELIRNVLVDLARVSTKSRGLQAARRILGNGLLTSEEPGHQEIRRLVQPAFHAERIQEYTDVMNSAVRRRIEGWSDGDRIDVAEQMSGLTFDIVGRALFGAALESSTATVRAALQDLLVAYNRAFLPWFDLSLRIGTPTGRRVQRAAAQLDALVRELVRTGSGSLLSMFPQQFSQEQRRDEAMTLLLAGHETTAAALSFTWYLMATHPAERSWLEQEVDGADPDPAALPRTRAVVAEAMRLYPPAWVMGRRFAEPVELDGWRIPAGSHALLPQWVVHRDGRFWSRPREFVPQRWIGSDGRFASPAPRDAYFPFGAGRRMCLGESFAWTEAILTVARIARQWRMRPEPGYLLRLQAAITLRPAGAVPMVLERRVTR